MALKKSALYSSLWKSCDELRGGMDASQYKDYVLVLLFVKYVSDKYAGDANALIDVPAGGRFADMVALKNDKEIGDKINKLVARLADANETLKGAINVADFNDEEKLGKGKGQFYTPAEVSRVMAQVIELGKAKDARQNILTRPAARARCEPLITWWPIRRFRPRPGATGWTRRTTCLAASTARPGHAPHRRYLHPADGSAQVRPHGAAGRDCRQRLQPEPAALHRQYRAYDVYQHLMDYWAETMQDDAWMIATDGWQALQDGQPNTDLIPPTLIVARYLAAEQQAVEALQAARDAIGRQMEELDEEHGGEDGLLFEATTEKGKLTKASVKARLAAAEEGGIDVAEPGESALLKKYLALIEQESVAGKMARDAQKTLAAKVAAQYVHLSAADIQTLVVQDKWLAALTASVQSELDRVSQALTGRIRLLAERYATPLPALRDEVEVLARRVDAHLKTMGFTL